MYHQKVVLVLVALVEVAVVVIVPVEMGDSNGGCSGSTVEVTLCYVGRGSTMLSG